EAAAPQQDRRDPPTRIEDEVGKTLARLAERRSERGCADMAVIERDCAIVEWRINDRETEPRSDQRQRAIDAEDRPMLSSPFALGHHLDRSEQQECGCKDAAWHIGVAQNAKD